MKSLDKILAINKGRSSFQKIGFLYLLVLILVSLFLISRSYGLHPIVFADEYIYNKNARLLPFAQFDFPNFLYFLIYHSTNICKEGFLDCSRLLNVIFFVGASPFIYLVARMFLSNNVAFFLAVISILGPINSYTAYFMPESLYFFCFWVFAFVLIRLNSESRAWEYLIPGAVLGITSLVKPHALFLIPPVFLYLLLTRKRSERPWLRTGILSISIFVFSVLTIKFLLGFLIAGKSGLTLFGNYSSVAKTTKFTETFLSASMFSLWGHILALVLLFSLPISILILSIRKLVATKFMVDGLLKIEIFSLFILVTLLCVVSLYTANVVHDGPYESINRLHMRYYNFMFSLLMIIAAARMNQVKDDIKIKLVSCVIIGGLFLYGFFHTLTPFSPGDADCPELRGFYINLSTFHILGLIELLSFGIYFFNTKLGARAYSFVYLPIFLLTFSFYVNHKRDPKEGRGDRGFFRAGGLYEYAGADLFVGDVDAPGLLYRHDCGGRHPSYGRMAVSGRCGLCQKGGGAPPDSCRSNSDPCHGDAFPGDPAGSVHAHPSARRGEDCFWGGDFSGRAASLKEIFASFVQTLWMVEKLLGATGR